jgi:2-iminobutanoate/2-iminopropanoate deaminase
MTRKPISSGNLATPVGPYSIGIRSDAFVFVSGQVGQDPASGVLVADDVAAQTDQALRNLTVLLDAAGKHLDDVVRIGVYLTDMTTFAEVNEVYVKHFSSPYPARTVIGVSSLPLGAVVEIDAIVG